MTTATEARRPEAPPRAALGRLRWALALPFIAAAGVYAVYIARTSVSFQGRTYWFLFDDAMISMRYGRNLADGHGLVWNVGQRVEGYTNFLWTLWMAVLHAVGLPDRSASLALMASEAVILVLGLWVVHRIATLLAPGRPVVALAATILTGLYYPLVFWALRGMEVGLAALLVSTAVLLALELRERWTTRRCWYLAAVLSAAVLTRDDLLVPSAIVIAFLVWQLKGAQRRRTLLIAAGTVVAVIAAHEVFRVAYYHDALPNTYYLKLAGIPLGTRLHRGAVSLAYAWLYSLYAPLILAAAALWLRRRAVTPLVLPAAIFLAQSAYSLYVGGDAWEDVRFANRYIATAAPLVMVLAAIGAAELARLRGRAGVRTAAPVAAAFAIAGLLLSRDWFSTDAIGFPKTGNGWFPARGGVGIAVGALVLALPLLLERGARARRAAWLPAAATVLVAALALGAVDAHPVRYWLRSSAEDVPGDGGWAKTGVVIAQHTAPGTTVAMTAAGNTAYFDRRPAVDLLGKMDPVVAHGPPQPIPFRPGHSKWNYQHSIGGLRPTVITQLWYPTRDDLCRIVLPHYRQLGAQLYVRRGATGVDVKGLAAGLSALHFLTPLPPPKGCG